MLSPKISKSKNVEKRSDESELKTSKLARELKRLGDVNKPGLKQSDVNDITSKQKSKLRK